MPIRVIGRSALGWAAAALVLVGVSSGAVEKAPITIPGVAFAQAAILSHRYELARRVLGLLIKIHKDSIESWFLLAKLDEIQGRLTDAIGCYRQILVDHPELPRVRLDLALLLFKMGDDESAEYNLRLSLGEHLPPAVEANVFRVIDAIHARKRFQFNLTVAIAPDTNINNGPGQRQITIFGLPATLSDNARGQSGVGGYVAVTSEYRLPLDNDYRLRIGATGYRTQYANTDFDDMFVRTYVGPQRLFVRGDWSVLTVFDKRWYGDAPYSERFGPRVEGRLDISQRWQISIAAEYLVTSYSFEKYMNGTYADVTLVPTYALSSSAYAYLLLGFAQEYTEQSYLNNNLYRVGFGYHQEIAGGYTYSMQPEFQANPFQTENFLFGHTRSDRIYRVSTNLYNRKFNIRGFCPVLNYTFTRDKSNISLYDYDTNQIQLGLTRDF